MQPRTLAVRVCASCRRLLGVREWIGDDALPDETPGVEREPGQAFNWTATHGMCAACERGEEEAPHEVAAR